MTSFQGIRNIETEKNHRVTGEVKTYQMDPEEMERLYGTGRKTAPKKKAATPFNLEFAREYAKRGMTNKEVLERHPEAKPKSIPLLMGRAKKQLEREKELRKEYGVEDQENHVADVGKKVQEVKLEKEECKAKKEINSDVPSVSVEQRKEETVPSIHVEQVETKIGRIIMPCDLMGLEGVRWR